jgi:hypothetical protein
VTPGDLEQREPGAPLEEDLLCSGHRRCSCSICFLIRCTLPVLAPVLSAIRRGWMP